MKPFPKSRAGRRTVPLPLPLPLPLPPARVYFDTWSSIRPRIDREAPYWELIDHFSSEQYSHWLASLGRLVDGAAPHGPSPEACRIYERVVRFELAFLDAMFDGGP